jgi:hypothetical protein
MEIHNRDVNEQKSDVGRSGFDPDKRVEKNNISSLDNASFDPNKRIGNRSFEKMEDHKPIQNKIDGLGREKTVHDELAKEYSNKEGYVITAEAFLRNSDGKIVKDPVSGEARRIDFVISKDGAVVKSVEVTSLTADKREQMNKEYNIRNNGGNYIKDSNGELVKFPSNVDTQVERRV